LRLEAEGDPEQAKPSAAGVPRPLPAIEANLTHKRIDDAYASIHEIGTVPRGDREVMNGCGCRDEAIFDRHGFPGSPQPRQ